MCWDAARSPDLASTSKAPSHSGMEQWLCFLVRFTVTGDSSEITSDSLDACPSGVASRNCAAASAYSSVEAIIPAEGKDVNEGKGSIRSCV